MIHLTRVLDTWQPSDFNIIIKIVIKSGKTAIFFLLVLFFHEAEEVTSSAEGGGN